MPTPEQFAEAPVRELLEAAARGKAGIDQRLLHAIVARPAEAVPELVRWAQEDHEDDPIMLDDEVIAMLRHIKTPDAVPAYIHFLKLDPEVVPEELVEALYEIRDAALEPLLSYYSELDEEQGGEVAFILASFRNGDPRILKILLDRLEFDAGDTAIALGLFGDQGARPALEKLLGEIPESDAHVRRDITEALSTLESPIDDTTIALDIFADYPETAGPEFDLLDEEERLALLESTDTTTRLDAVSSFINRDLSPPVRARIFHLAQQDPAPQIRGVAWQTLADETSEKSIADAMFARLADVEAPMEERTGALIGLHEKFERPEIRCFAEEFYLNPEARAAAMEAMWRSMDRSFSEYFPPHLQDEDEEIRRQAIWGVGYLGIQSHSPKLESFFENTNFRADALHAYALAARHEISRAHIRSFLRKIEERAGGLSEGERELVQLALDERLMLHGHKPVFYPE